MIGRARYLLVVLHFVCPLLFFTNLTRNPYITQIALLNIGLLAAWGWALVEQSREGRWEMPRTYMDLPLAAWLGVCAASWLYAYYGHRPVFRDSMFSEGIRVFLFTLFNSVLVFYLAAASAKSCSERPDEPLAQWAVFAVAWGGMWLLFPDLRGASIPSTNLLSLFFNPYGAFVWGVGIAGVLWLSRSGTVHAVWHVIMTVGFLASAYGILQYFGMEFLWPKVLNPYGGRSVSTFGNPNFMSSYQVMVLPLAVVYYLQARTYFQRIAYAVVLLSIEAGLFCSLTRSSWVGAAAAMLPLLLSRRLRRLARENMEFHGLVASGVLLIAVFWPQSTIGGYTSSLFGRLGEVKDIMTTTYSPFYQRVLIWMCAWTMGAENPILGKGWGLFELFYPFYQGHYLDYFDFFRNMRTHANNSHNEIMEVWSQTGIAGVGVLFWTWVVFFRGIWEEARPGVFRRTSLVGTAAPEENPSSKKKIKKTVQQSEDGERIWLLAGSASVVGMLVDNLLNVSLHFAVPGFLFWWQAGTVAGHLARSQGLQRSLRFPGRKTASAAALGAVLLAAAGSWYWVGYWQREVHYFIGFKLMRNQDFPGAIRHLTRAYEWNRFDVNNNYELGNAYARSQQADKALWGYQEALHANAGYDEIYFNKATILMNQGKKDEAVKAYLTSWAINPISPQLYMSLSRHYLQDPVKNRTEVLTLLQRAVHFFPEDTNFLNNLAYLYSLEEDFEKAEDIYTRLLGGNPLLTVAERNLRTSLAKSGRKPPEILARIDDLRSLETDLRARRFGPEILEKSRRLAALFPQTMAVQLYQGNLELMHGNGVKAEMILTDLLKKEPRNISVMMNLGIALKQQGKSSQAAQVFQNVLSLDPNNDRAKSELASAR